jgi:hypothetical protein
VAGVLSPVVPGAGCGVTFKAMAPGSSRVSSIVALPEEKSTVPSRNGLPAPFLRAVQVAPVVRDCGAGFTVQTAFSPARYSPSAWVQILPNHYVVRP